MALDGADVEQGRLVGILGRRRLDQQRRGMVLAHHIREVVHRVDGRLGRPQRDHRRRPEGGFARHGAARAAVGTAHRMPGPPNERAGGGAREQQRPDHEGEHADDRRARRADEQPEQALEPATDRAPVPGAERRQQAEAGDGQPGPERPHVDERAARDHQGSDDHERDRRHVCGGADPTREDPAADHPPTPTQIEDRGEKDAQREQAEPGQLEMLLALRLAFASLLADPRRHARPERAPLLPPSRHRRQFGVRSRRPTSGLETAG